MRKAAKQIAVCAFILLLLCIACRILVFNQFSIYIPQEETNASQGPAEGRATAAQPGVLRTGEAEYRAGYVRIPVFAEAPGGTDIFFSTAEDESASFHVMKVDCFLTVYDMNTGNFTGDTAVLISVTLFWLLVSAIMLWHFFRAKGPAFYDYGTIYYAGFSLFAMATVLVMLSTAVSHFAHPETHNMYSVYSAISGASVRYMMLTTPLMILFAGALAVSNIALLRHERHPRLQNFLGLLLSVLLAAGEAAGWYLFSRDFMGSEWEWRIDCALQNTYATFFIYCQCMLTGAVICGIKAARHRPDPDKDFIIIHGCWFRQDGTLPPLLRGRADKALEFWRTQKEKTGKEATFVPSGGQGADEPMPEAEAIRQYLLSRGIEDRLILPETRSVNTLQNMNFSREVIGKTGRDGKTVFATSSYHVFRSGLLAREAGLSADGIGGRTKWWFWPNAFIRETAGLLQKRWKQEVLLIVLLIGFFVLLSMFL